MLCVKLECQNTVGAAAAATAQVLTKFQDEADILLATAKDYRLVLST